jgi:glycosyltransferase involved in cell wall biosynthesis
VRLGVYADLVYSADAAGISANRAFVKFVAALPPRVDELVIFGRLSDHGGPFPYVLPSEAVRFVPLPHYDGLRELRSVAAAIPESVRIVRRELPNLDALWLFGPHPLALAFERAARRARVPVLLGVRQDFPAYIRSRAAWAFPAAVALELAWRRVGRRAPAIVVGEELAQHYRHGAPVLATGFSLVRAADIVPPEVAATRDWSGGLRLLTVGRLSPEKNPLLLADVVAALDDRWRLDVIGDGPLRSALEARSRSLDVHHRVRVESYVPNGPALWARYRNAHAFLHVSRTEGIPQVLYEAQASGLPTVATDVGGVRGAMNGSVVLVPADDARAAAAAVEQIGRDAVARAGLIDTGFRQVRAQTQEAQLDSIADFIRQQFG